MTQSLASWSENIPFTSSKCLSATEGDQIFAASRAGERVLHTELGVGKAEITFKRLGFEMSVGGETSVRHRFVCGLVAGFQLSGQDSFRCAHGPGSLSGTSPGWTHPSGTATGESEWKKDPNG